MKKGDLVNKVAKVTETKKQAASLAYSMRITICGFQEVLRSFQSSEYINYSVAPYNR